MQGRYYCHYEEIWRPAEEFNYIIKLPMHNDWSRIAEKIHLKEISYNEADDLIEELGIENIKPRAICVFCESMGKSLCEKYHMRKSRRSQLLLFNFVLDIYTTGQKIQRDYVSNYKAIIR